MSKLSLLAVAAILLIVSEVAAASRDLNETASVEKMEAVEATTVLGNGLNDAKQGDYPSDGYGGYRGDGYGGYAGGGYGGYPGQGGYGGYPGCGGGYAPFPGRDYGGGRRGRYCWYGCCRWGYFGRCRRCCPYANAAIDHNAAGVVSEMVDKP